MYGNNYARLCPDDNGWVNLDLAVKKLEIVKNTEFQFGFIHNGNPTKCRDIRLKDFELNNGWTRTDESFPTKSGIYVFLSKGKISHEIRLRFPLLQEEENHYRNDFTHFRVPEDYPLPIY